MSKVCTSISDDMRKKRASSDCEDAQTDLSYPCSQVGHLYKTLFKAMYCNRTHALMHSLSLSGNIKPLVTYLFLL